MQLSKIVGKQGGSVKAGLVDYAFAAGLSLAALALYMVTKAGYVFPGASARLTALWRGLDASSAFEYPLTAVFAKACGASNALSVFCGAVATGLVFLLVSRFVRTRTRGDFTAAHAASASRLAGLTASLVFMLTPAVHEASTHLEPAIFDAMWALLAFAAIIPCEALPRSLSWFGALLAGALAGLGMADTPLFVALLPLYIGSVWQSSSRGGSNAWALTTVFIFSSLVAFFSFAIASPCDMATLMRGLHDIAAGWVSRGGCPDAYVRRRGRDPAFAVRPDGPLRRAARGFVRTGRGERRHSRRVLVAPELQRRARERIGGQVDAGDALQPHRGTRRLRLFRRGAAADVHDQPLRVRH